MDRVQRGFTLVELLIVIVVLGILAAIAIPRFASVREDSFLSAVTMDLKHLATLQELHHSNNGQYAASITDLASYEGSSGVTVTINEATRSGWAATGTHSGLSDRMCGIFYGSASAANATPAVLGGVVTCQP